MRRITTVSEVEALIGSPNELVLMKTVTSLDDDCLAILAIAPIAGLGFRDPAGQPHTTVIGGTAGFMRAESATQITFDRPSTLALSEHYPSVSLLFFLPGTHGETLRVNGQLAEITLSQVTIAVEEAFVHCAKCILRSKLFDVSTTITSSNCIPQPSATSLNDPQISQFLAQSPFVLLSSWDASGGSDTSPKGDRMGFVRVLDGQTLAIADRKGNQRADTVRNLLQSAQIGLAFLVPGREEVLHINGTGYLTDDLALCASMALGEKPPHAAFVIKVQHIRLQTNSALQQAKLWDASSQAAQAELPTPNLLAIVARHITKNKHYAAQAALNQEVDQELTVAAGEASISPSVRQAYQQSLTNEGY
ncbi:pyridoxamine 5'-phosphate oxidase family protein [Herpetosiphon sp. NSE202]|uniref:pyridoxamine 5'-phosphate oxidase family protein n=1 Tax=Herpetosiphon sp. NSE202 TaxID=3351349 RepID=UPI00364147DE